MKRTTIWIGAALILLPALGFNSCKKSEVETGTLKVITSVGVTGTPAAGEYTVQVGDERAYGYSLEAGYNSLTVLLDNKEVAASGSFTVSGDHTLQAYSEGNIQYELTVTVDTGVTGTPEAGTYAYPAGTEIPYSYALADGWADLSVKIDGTEAAASGTITVSKTTTVYASAEKLYNTLGDWKLEESYDDGSEFSVVVTFSGIPSAGTVTDSEGGSGTFTNSGAEIEFTLKFPDVTYEYDGSLTDTDTMSGTCKRYRTTDSVVSGDWSATRVTAAASLPRRAKTGAGRKG